MKHTPTIYPIIDFNSGPGYDGFSFKTKGHEMNYTYDALTTAIANYFNKLESGQKVSMFNIRTDLNIPSWQVFETMKVLKSMVEEQSISVDRVKISEGLWTKPKYQNFYYTINTFNKKSDTLIDRVRDLVGTKPVVTLEGATDEQLLAELKKRIGR